MFFDFRFSSAEIKINQSWNLMQNSVFQYSIPDFSQFNLVKWNIFRDLQISRWVWIWVRYFSIVKQWARHHLCYFVGRNAIAVNIIRLLFLVKEVKWIRDTEKDAVSSRALLRLWNKNCALFSAYFAPEKRHGAWQKISHFRKLSFRNWFKFHTCSDSAYYVKVLK